MQQKNMQGQQKNIIQIVDFTNLAGTTSKDLIVSFPVKEINIRTGYTYWVDDSKTTHSYVLRSDLVQGDAIGLIGSYRFNEAVAGPISRDWYGESLTSTNLANGRFIFKDPVQVNGTYTVSVKELLDQAMPDGGRILISYDFIG